jgi:hypothetical protein
MALAEYAEAFQSFAFAGKDVTLGQRGALSAADVQLDRFGLKNNPKRIAIMKAISSRAETFAGKEIGNDTEVFYASDGGIWKGTREAIHAKRLDIVPASWDFVPYQWLNEEGFIDLELTRKYPCPNRAICRSMTCNVFVVSQRIIELYQYLTKYQGWNLSTESGSLIAREFSRASQGNPNDQKRT